MIEYRLARSGEVERQKEIWKLCFGDPQSYIDFYFANRYKEQETLLLLDEGEILAMLTMIPVKTVTPANRRLQTAMLYAIATHPEAQNRGFATQLMEFSNQYLSEHNTNLSVLVPAKQDLFDFYRKRGYQEGFYIRETTLTREQIDGLVRDNSCKCTISTISAEEYNQRRNTQLRNRLHISYADEEIAYQKKVSRLSGADLYGVDSENSQGCIAVERIDADKVMIKECLLSEGVLNQGLKLIAQELAALEYILRTPAFLGEHLGGATRPFAMLRIHKEMDLPIGPQELGYMGFAFD